MYTVTPKLTLLVFISAVKNFVYRYIDHLWVNLQYTK